MTIDEYPPAVTALLVQLDGTQIASLRSVVSGIIHIINEPASTAKDLREVIEIDPPLAARVLKLANSAYYAPRIKILDIMQAIIFVGFDAVKELALSQKVGGVFGRDGRLELDLWRHSVAVALTAKVIYRREFCLRGDNAYAAGLLHDIGIIALEQVDPKAWRDLGQALKEGGGSMTEIETQALGFDHALLGRAITRRWEFPEELVAAIGCHHRPDLASGEAVRLAHTLFVADQYVRSQGYGFEGMPMSDPGLFRESLQRLALTRQGLALLFAEVDTEIRRMEARGLLSNG